MEVPTATTNDQGSSFLFVDVVDSDTVVGMPMNVHWKEWVDFHLLVYKWATQAMMNDSMEESLTMMLCLFQFWVAQASTKSDTDIEWGLRTTSNDYCFPMI